MTSVDLILKRILQKCIAHPSISTSLASQSPPPQPIADIVFPADVPSLHDALVAAGAHPKFALAMDQTYQKWAAYLRTRSLWAITHLSSNSSKFHHDASEEKVISMFTQLYLRQLVIWREEGVALYLKYSAAGNKAQFGVPKFNHEYVPLLEHFFAENPFPTHADKTFLAKKSAMSYRQIHVWFQNRRNRMKKEGQVLKKKPMAEGATLPLDTLHQRMGKFIVPEEREVRTSHSSHLDRSANDEMLAADSQRNPLESLAPPHAFPFPYPSSCSYDPFPAKNGMTNFGTPEWLRAPISTLVQHAPLDIDDLTGHFSRMNVLDDSSLRLPSKGDSFAAVAAFTVVPPSAPHPALIRGIVTDISTICGPLPSVPATARRRRVFNTSSSQLPFSLTPISEIRHRKVAPLPRRSPHGNTITLDISEASVPSASLSPSRSFSFESDGSSQNRVLSSASSTSSSSSSIFTSPSSSPSASTQLPSPSAPLFNLSSSMVDLFGDVLQGAPSPAEGLQLDV